MANWSNIFPFPLASNSRETSIASSMLPASEVNTIFAPKAFITARRSTLIFSGMTKIIRYPRIAATIASAIPVFPLVASINVSPDLISPRISACFIMLSAGLSLTEPAGLLPSSLPKIVLLGFPDKRCNLTSGVLPIKDSNVKKSGNPLITSFFCFFVIYNFSARNVFARTNASSRPVFVG